MPSYYLIKIQALKSIDEQYHDGKNPKEIIYQISLTYGFGENFVMNRIQLLEDLTEIAERKKSREKKTKGGSDAK